jgi:hypothetical protein
MGIFSSIEKAEKYCEDFMKDDVERKWICTENNRLSPIWHGGDVVRWEDQIGGSTLYITYYKLDIGYKVY